MQQILSLVGGFFCGVVFLLGCEKPREVESIQARQGAIQETLIEPARTQLSQTYRISMPLQGRIERIDLKPGDQVKAGQLLAVFDRVVYEQNRQEAHAVVQELEASIRLNEYDELEKTSEIQTQAMISAFGDMIKASEAQVDAEKARSQYTYDQLTRLRKLFAEQRVPESEQNEAELNSQTSLIELRRQEFYLAASKTMMTVVKLGPTYLQQWLVRKRLEREGLLKQLVQAKARLSRAEYELSLARIQSPTNGTVLEKYEQGDSSLPAGQALLLIGNLQEMEAVAEVLTQDALRLNIGSPVQLEMNSIEKILNGRVLQIEPSGFTKLSSLGVEQQRVKVILALEEIPSNLGVGYRLQARFMIRSKENAILVPRYSVLQAPDQSFYVFKIQQETLMQQPVTIGLRSDFEMEILSGLSPQDSLVKTVDVTMHTGEKVKILTNSKKK